MNTKQFVHLHVHSHYSIMNGCNTVPQLVDRAIKDRMKGMALTDTGNMYGIMEFFDYVSKVNAERKEKGQSPFKPIMDVSCTCRQTKAKVLIHLRCWQRTSWAIRT